MHSLHWQMSPWGDTALGWGHLKYVYHYSKMLKIKQDKFTNMSDMFLSPLSMLHEQ